MHITWKNCFKIVVSLLVLFFCVTYLKSAVNLLMMVLSAAVPLFIGGAIAYIVNIVMTFYEKHLFTNPKNKVLSKLKAPLCIALAFLTIILISAFIIGLIVPQLISCIKFIGAYLPGIIDYIVVKIGNLNIVPQDILKFLKNAKFETYIGDIIEFLASGAGSVVEILFKTIVNVFTGVTTAFLSIIFSVYLLVSKCRLHVQVKRCLNRYIPEKYVSKIYYVFRTVNECFHRYIVAQFTESVILGILCTIGMIILSLPYPTMIGALVGFTALIPIVGAFLGAAIGALMILTVSPIESLIFLIFLIILQQLEENLIYPRVVGSSVNLPGIWVLAAITVGGGVMGILGIVLAVPFAATIYRIVRDDVGKHEIITNQEE